MSIERKGDQHDDALEHLLTNLVPRLLRFLEAPGDIEAARTLHTDLRQTLYLLLGGETW
jgi:hypothetical protein